MAENKGSRPTGNSSPAARSTGSKRTAYTRRTQRAPAVRTYQLTIEEVVVEVVRKPMKTWRLTVSRAGRVRLAAPPHLSDEGLRQTLEQQLAWIRRHQARMEALPSEAPLDLETGSRISHLGQEYRLEVREVPGRAVVSIEGRTLRLCVPPEGDTASRARALERWRREELHALAAPLIAQWQARMGVHVVEWRIRSMKSRWGSCVPQSGHVCLNLHLIKRPPECIEYLVVHELAHLIERNHSPRFWALVAQHLPAWRALRKLLNERPPTAP